MDKTEKCTDLIAVSFDGHKGMIHRPASGFYSGTSVVICAPLGRDRIWTYRSLFHWAERLAAQGHQVLRYDHRGDGDSLDVEEDCIPWQRWVRGVEQAANFTRAGSGANALILAGLRIGATLACEATNRVRPDGLILWDPLRTGNAWLRELQLASAMAVAANAADNLIEVNGVRLTSSSIKCLEAVDIAKSCDVYPPILLASPAAPKGLIQALGPNVHQVPFHGYTKLFKDTYVNAAPLQLFEATEHWLSARARASSPAPQIAACVTPVPFDGGTWIERSIEFDQGLRGTLCLPKYKRSSQAAILCSAAANPRSGDGNFNTRTSRALAASGIATLRFDFTGVGESPARAGAMHVYETCRIAELKSAALVLNGYGYKDLAAIGTCTGGFHAVRAAFAGVGIQRAVAINALVYWRVGTPLDRTALVASMRSAYLRAPVQLRKCLTVRHKIRAWLMPQLMRLQRLVWPKAVVRSTKAEFRRASQRGVGIMIITGSADWSRNTLEEFGPSGQWFCGLRGVSSKIIQGLDHSVSMAESQLVVMRELQRFLGASENPPPHLLPQVSGQNNWGRANAVASAPQVALR